jgi:hypothetical protein
MKFKELAEDWKRVGMCITVAGTIAAAAGGCRVAFCQSVRS